MNVEPDLEFHELVSKQARILSSKLKLFRAESLKPNTERLLRLFSLDEAAYYLGVTPSTVKKIQNGPAPKIEAGRKLYTAEQIQQIRQILAPRRKHYDPTRSGDEELQIICCINFKGGSCKTTTTAGLIQHLALTGHRVLAIDLDPQASLSALHGIQPDIDDNLSLFDAITFEDDRKSIKDVIRQTCFPNLSIIPANLQLQEYEYQVPYAIKEGKPVFFRLLEAVREVEGEFDVVVIDCPPQLGYLTLSALMAASGVIVTFHPQMLDMLSMSQFMSMMGDIMGSLASKRFKSRTSWMRFLITRHNPSDLGESGIVGFLRQLFPAYVLKNHMLATRAVSQAGLKQKTIYEIERKDKDGNSIVERPVMKRAMESMHAVNEEIIALIHTLGWGRKSTEIEHG